MNNSVRVFSSPAELASKLAGEIATRIIASANKERPFSIALSGGSTPALLYAFLFDEFASEIPWEFVHLFWGDERCVPPEHPDSNFGFVRKHLIEKTVFSSSNVHRIKGEEDPIKEAIRYSGEISAILPARDRFPVFDLILLGMGNDGHVASIFHDQLGLIDSDHLCGVAIHPFTGQKRITLTGKVINNAESVIFQITGKKKAELLRQIIKEETNALRFPASYIKPVYGSLHFFIDRDAASLLT